MLKHESKADVETRIYAGDETRLNADDDTPSNAAYYETRIEYGYDEDASKLK
jgi:hypothetical protein